MKKPLTADGSRAVSYQQIGDGQVHEHRVYPRSSLAPTFQDDRQHRDVSYGRDDHEYAVGDYGDHVALVEFHVVRKIRLIEHGRVRHVVHAGPDRWRTDVHSLGDRVQHGVCVRVHHIHDEGRLRRWRQWRQ